MAPSGAAVNCRRAGQGPGPSGASPKIVTAYARYRAPAMPTTSPRSPGRCTDRSVSASLATAATVAAGLRLLRIHSPLRRAGQQSHSGSFIGCSGERPHQLRLIQVDRLPWRDDPVDALRRGDGDEGTQPAGSSHGGDRPSAADEHPVVSWARDPIQARLNGRRLLITRPGVGVADADVGAGVGELVLAVDRAWRQLGR